MSDAAPSLSFRLRQRLAETLAAYVDREGLTPAEAADRLGVSQARADDLVRGRADRFSIDALVTMLDRVGVPVTLAAGGPGAGRPPASPTGQASGPPGALLHAGLVTLAPFVALLDADGTLLEVSRSVAEASAIDPADAVGTRLGDSYWFAHDPAARRAARAACARAARGDPASFAAVVRMADDRHLPVDVSILPVRDGTGEVTYLVATGADVSGRETAGATRRASEAQYRTLWESIGEGFCVIEMVYDGRGRAVDYRFVDANPAFERHTGLVDAVGRTARELVPTLERYWVDTYARVAETGAPTRFRQGSAAMGREFSVEAFRVGDPAGRRVALLFTDVTERVRAETALREANETLEAQVEARTREVRRLARALTLAEQEARRRVAHMLHEDVQQVLHGVQIEAHVAGADRAGDLVGRAIQLTRSLSHELSPPVLREDQLAALFAALAEDQRARHGLDVAVDADAVAVPEEHLRILLYHIVGELLSNVARHAGTARATVRAERRDGRVRIEVADEGVGFEPPPPEALRAGDGLGLPTVWERVTLVGGRLVLDSSPGTGTRVTIELPADDA